MYEEKNNNTDMESTQSRSKRSRNDQLATTSSFAQSVEEDFGAAKKAYDTTPTLSREEENKVLKRMKTGLQFVPASEVKESSMAPLTALYILCRDNDFPPEFLKSLSGLNNLPRSKLLGVLQMLTQMKSPLLGEVDLDFVQSKDSQGLLSDELVSRVNGIQDKPVQKIDSSHMLRWICSRFSTKVAIIPYDEDSAIFTLGSYCLQQFLDKELVIQTKGEASDSFLDKLSNLTTKLIDWTQWKTEDCESFTVGVSSATSVPVTVVHITKEFYRYCISLLNLVCLTLKGDDIVITPSSSKVTPIGTHLDYNKTIRNSISYTDASKLIARILGTTYCQDKALFAFSPLSYLLTYAVSRIVDDFNKIHKNDFTLAQNQPYPSNLSFLKAVTTIDKANAYKNLKNIESFYELQANNRRYRSAVNMGIQEYDTVYFVGPFERTVRRAYYLNQLFKGYCYIGLGSGQEPRMFNSDPEEKKKRFYNMGVTDGNSSTQPFIDLIREIVIPSVSTNVVFYMPIVKHDGISALCKKMLDAGFKSVRMWTSDQHHSQFFPLEFSKEVSTTYNFSTSFSKFESDTADTVLSVIMFNSMIRVLEAEKRYMIRVQLGIDNTYRGSFVTISELPEEILSLTSGAKFEEVEFIEKPYELDMEY